jgi:hypothetical protein
MISNLTGILNENNHMMIYINIKQDKLENIAGTLTVILIVFEYGKIRILACQSLQNATCQWGFAPLDSPP